MKINTPRLTRVGLGAALALMLSMDVEAAPMSYSSAPSISTSDGSIVKVTTRVRVRRHHRRVPRQMVHRHRPMPHRAN